jgi:P27 family predicted phage terminase small subunit
VASELHGMGVLTTIDRAALAAYCQAYGRWVEAEERMRESSLIYKTRAHACRCPPACHRY